MTVTEGLPRAHAARPDEDVDLLSLLPASWVARARSVRSRWRPVDTVALVVVVLVPLIVTGALVVRGKLLHR